MAIRPACDYYKKELTDFGALLFSPPDAGSTVKKFHICKPCYARILADMEKEEPLQD